MKPPRIAIASTLMYQAQTALEGALLDDPLTDAERQAATKALRDARKHYEKLSMSMDFAFWKSPDGAAFWNQESLKAWRLTPGGGW